MKSYFASVLCSLLLIVCLSACSLGPSGYRTKQQAKVANVEGNTYQLKTDYKQGEYGDVVISEAVLNKIAKDPSIPYYNRATLGYVANKFCNFFDSAKLKEYQDSYSISGILLQKYVLGNKYGLNFEQQGHFIQKDGLKRIEQFKAQNDNCGPAAKETSQHGLVASKAMVTALRLLEKKPELVKPEYK